MDLTICLNMLGIIVSFPMQNTPIISDRSFDLATLISLIMKSRQDLGILVLESSEMLYPFVFIILIM